MNAPAPILTDGDLELVVPDRAWLDATLAALQLPSTVDQMPELAKTNRQQLVDFIDRTPRGFDAGDPEEGVAPSYHFWMRRRGERLDRLPLVGGLGFRIGRGPNIERVIGHIGYHVYPFARGHHFAERACRLLVSLARRHGLSPLWITCNPDNLASRRTCERLGATLVEIVPVPSDHPLYARGEKEKCRYRWEI